MAITLTETAAHRVRTFMENRGKGIGLRLGVRTTGCSGMAYVLEFVDDLEEGGVECLSSAAAAACSDILFFFSSYFFFLLLVSYL